MKCLHKDIHFKIEYILRMTLDNNTACVHYSHPHPTGPSHSTPTDLSVSCSYLQLDNIIAATPFK